MDFLAADRGRRRNEAIVTVETTEYRRHPARLLARGTALAVVLALAGCSYVPDYANPVNWYDSITGDDAPPPEQDDSALAQPVPGSDQNFPTLASVPDRPSTATSSDERQRVQQGLVADRDNARYTEQVANTALQQQAANTAPPPPPPAPPPAASTATADSGGASRPPTLNAAPPPPAPPPPTTVAQADSAPAQRTPPPPPPPPAPSSSSSTGVPAPAASTAPPSTADLTNLPNGRRRMAVPQIVQRGPAPAPIQSGSVARSPAIAATTPPPVPSAATVPPPPPPAPSAASAPALPSQVRAASAPAPTPTPTPTPTPRVAAQPSAPASSAVAQRLNLPVAPDQQALNEAFSRNVAAQQGMTVAALPVGSPAPGGAVVGTGGTVYVGGSPGRPNYTTTSPGFTAGAGPSPIGAPPAGLVATINFGHGSAGLSAMAQRDIRAVAAEAKRTGRTVRVVGHSSQRTGNMPFERHLIANFNISLDRANRVAQALARAGVDGSRIVVEAVGDTQPLYFEFMPNGEAENRRAEIFLE